MKRAALSARFFLRKAMFHLAQGWNIRPFWGLNAQSQDRKRCTQW